ncbi:hypothetical protein N665_0186s0041 [Sinapis alba]|nr:hypothetical protein N665_0186s0041 [Sinapis alba]
MRASSSTCSSPRNGDALRQELSLRCPHSVHFSIRSSLCSRAELQNERAKSCLLRRLA